MKKFQTYFSNTKLILSICLIPLFFANTKSFAQELIPYEEPLASRIEKSRKIVQEAEFIFQGKYVSQSVQHSDDRYISIVKTVFNVNHIYKGKLKLGTVVIEESKFVSHEYIDTIYEDGKAIERKIFLDQSSHLRNNDYLMDRSAIFFCKAKNSSYVYNDTMDNKQILEFADSRFSTINYGYNDYKDEKYELGGLNKLLFKVKTDFHKFLFESDSTIKLPLSTRESEKRDSANIMNRIELRNRTIDSLRKEFNKPSNMGKAD